MTSEEGRRIHLCDFGRRNFVWHWSEKFCLILSLNVSQWWWRATFWRYSELELLTNLRETSWNTFWCLKCFNVFQTLKLIWTTKPCLDVKTFCDDMCFWSLLWSWQKDVNRRLRICFVSRSDTSTRTIATWAETSSCLCAVKVAELWDWLTWLRGRSFVLFKDDVLDADPSRSRGFEGKWTFRMVAELPACSS